MAEKTLLMSKKEGSMRSIAERRAAWRGIDRPILPPRVNTARFRTNGGGSSPGASSPARSPCLVIPPGLSPAALLDSPVLFQVPSHNPIDNSTSTSQENLQVSEIQQTNDSNSTELEPNKTENSSNTITGPKKSLDDGYNWRKYGQKIVKGCEFPRNYYKCTYPNCNMKKMVEQSVEGQITDIVYKGNHEHPLPDTSNLKICNQRGYMSKRCVEMSEVSTVSEVCESGNDRNALGVGDSVSCVERSGLSCNDDANDVDCGDRESKRRKNEGYATNTLPASEPSREPRVVVQTVSEIDLLDDGYKWRKYGQKVVKGNPNPRSYYKCTSVGCPVRKHIERAPHDLKSVITTYEGKHNHEVPVSANIINNSKNNNNNQNSMTVNYTQFNDLNSSSAAHGMRSLGENAGGSGAVCLSNLNMFQDFGSLSYLELLRPLIDQTFGGTRFTEYRENNDD